MYGLDSVIQIFANTFAIAHKNAFQIIIWEPVSLNGAERNNLTVFFGLYWSQKLPTKIRNIPTRPYSVGYSPNIGPANKAVKRGIKDIMGTTIQTSDFCNATGTVYLVIQLVIATDTTHRKKSLVSSRDQYHKMKVVKSIQNNSEKVIIHQKTSGSLLLRRCFEYVNSTDWMRAELSARIYHIISLR